MFKNLKRNWIRLWEARPGRRFQNYYRRKHRDKRGNDVGPSQWLGHFAEQQQLALRMAKGR